MDINKGKDLPKVIIHGCLTQCLNSKTNLIEQNLRGTYKNQSSWLGNQVRRGVESSKVLWQKHTNQALTSAKKERRRRKKKMQ